MKDRYHDRKSTRLPEWDYTMPGYYYVTICVREMACLLGKVDNESIVLSPEGRIVHQTWLEVPGHYPDASVEPFIVMPNHFHAIVKIGKEGLCESEAVAKPHNGRTCSLTEIIRGFKTWSARRINAMNDTTGTPFWQRSFYDRVVRNEKELHAIEKYIQANPQDTALGEPAPTKV